MKNTRELRREKNREKINQQAKERRAKNKEKVREIKKRHYRKNKSDILAKQRAYMKERRKNNPEKCRLYAQKRTQNNLDHIASYREQYYLSSSSVSPCHDHPSNQGTKVPPMNVYSPKATELFDFTIAWLLDLSRNAQTINE
jgi:hypothetical protein